MEGTSNLKTSKSLVELRTSTSDLIIGLTLIRSRLLVQRVEGGVSSAVANGKQYLESEWLEM